MGYWPREFEPSPTCGVTFLGVPVAGMAGPVPYDFRAPSPAKIRASVWNPASDRVLGAHLFGVGWSVNLGAVAAKAGLVTHENDPLASVPDEAFTAVVLVPAALAVLSAVRGRNEPAWRRALTGAVGVASGGAALLGLAVAVTVPAPQKARR